jgi:hypothetical protein
MAAAHSTEKTQTNGGKKAGIMRKKSTALGDGNAPCGKALARCCSGQDRHGGVDGHCPGCIVDLHEHLRMDREVWWRDSRRGKTVAGVVKHRSEALTHMQADELDRLVEELVIGKRPEPGVILRIRRSWAKMFMRRNPSQLCAPHTIPREHSGGIGM